MLSSEVSELCRALLRMQLLTQQQLDDALHELPLDLKKIEPLIELLQHKNLLTSYQASQLRKGDISNLVLGEYALLYRNASGSFARVFRAKSLRDGSMVGIKVLRHRWSSDPKLIAQFKREAEQGKRLRHENIVPIYDVGEDNDQFYLTMEFVEGGNLRDFINIRKKLSPLEACKCALEMARGLAYALSKGLTHRDLKMTNVLMSSTGVARLVDFGLAVPHQFTPSQEESSETAQRALEYATLEKGTGAPRNDPRSDLYFLGAILYELLTGSPPFGRTRDRNERSQFSRYSQIRPISSVDPDLPKCLTRVVDRLLQVNLALRYQTPGEVVNDLTAALHELRGGTPSNSEIPAITTPTKYQGIVMCVENRTKRQDLIREYFTNKSYRVLFFTDFLRALQRLNQIKPDCLIVMGDTVRDRLESIFRDVAQAVDDQPPYTLLVLAGWQNEAKPKITENGRMKVIVQPVTLHDLHQHVKAGIALRPTQEPPIG
ncbi:MAG: serine/threonine-protein kinase [Planctomycetales bacterium]